MYSIHILRRAIKDIAALPDEYARLVGQHIDQLGQNPYSRDAKKLRGEMAYSLRVGVYRILGIAILVCTIYTIVCIFDTKWMWLRCWKNCSRPVCG